MHTLFRIPALVLILGAGALLGGCATINDRFPEARYTMTERQVLPLAQRLTITYEGAEDSRCPANARCVWPGRLLYRFTMRIGSVAQSFYLAQGQPGYMSPVLRGSHIELDHLTPPPPRALAGSGPVSYPVTINMYAQ